MSGSTTAGARAWAKFLDHLKKEGVDFAEIVGAEGRVREELAGKCAATPMEVALILSRWGAEASKVEEERTVAGGGGAAEFLRRAEERTVEPWRVQADKLERVLTVIRQQSPAQQLADIKQLASDVARNGGISKEDAITLMYLLYANEEGRLFLAHLILQKSERERVQLHNWFVAKHAGNAFTEANGERLASLELPLFPPEFTAINTRLLASVGTQGGGNTAIGRSIYREKPLRVGLEGGDCYLPVQVAPDGTQYVDASAIESAFYSLKHQVTDRANRRALPPRVQEERRCWTCGGTGHTQRNCPQKSEDKRPTAKNSKQPPPKPTRAPRKDVKGGEPEEDF